jgi:hypothetical protein
VKKFERTLDVDVISMADIHTTIEWMVKVERPIMKEAPKLFMKAKQE